MRYRIVNTRPWALRPRWRGVFRIGPVTHTCLARLGPFALIRRDFVMSYWRPANAPAPRTP